MGKYIALIFSPCYAKVALFYCLIGMHITMQSFLGGIARTARVWLCRKLNMARVLSGQDGMWEIFSLATVQFISGYRKSPIYRGGLFTALILLTIILIYPLNSASASSNANIKFQGKIVNISNGTNLTPGTPACVVAGSGNDTCDFKVGIYSESAGGVLLWEETHQNVEIESFNGVFSLLLNSKCNNWDSPSSSAECTGTPTVTGIDWGSDPSVYIQVEFSPAGNSTFTEIFSRTPLTSSPFAYYADKAGGVVGGLDTVYTNDGDKILNVNNPLGLKFLLDNISNSTFTVENQGTGDALYINQTNEGTALRIMSSASNTDTVVIDSSTNSTANGLSILFDSTNLTSGAVLRISDNFVDRLTIKDNGAFNWLGGSGAGFSIATASGNENLSLTNGNLKVGNGTPNLPLDGEDAYVEGTLEVDSSFNLGSFANLNDNEIKAFRVENLAIAPVCDNPRTGKIYHNTTDGNTYACDGIGWQKLNNDPVVGVLDSIIEVKDTTTGVNLNVSVPVAIPWTQQIRLNPGFTHSPITNNSRIYMDSPGWYELSYNVSHTSNGSQSKNIKCYARLNGSSIVTESTSYSNSINTTNPNATNTGNVIFHTTLANEYIETTCLGVGGWVDAQGETTITGESLAYIKKLDATTGNTATSNNSVVDLDVAYQNDADKTMVLSDLGGLKFLSTTAGNIIFDLYSTGDFVVSDGGAPVFTVSDSGKIGIKTNSPLATLDIYDAGSAAAPSLIFLNDVDTGIFYGGLDSIAFSAGGIEQIRITPNGLRFASKTADPLTASDGDVWYRSDTGNLTARTKGWNQEIRTVATAQVYQQTPVAISAPSAMTWGGTATDIRYIDPEFTHSTGANSSRVYINSSGYYRISYNVSWSSTGATARNPVCYLGVNGTAFVNLGVSYSYSNGATTDKGTNTSEIYRNFNAGEYYEVYCESPSGNVLTIANQSWTIIELIRKI